MFLCLVLAAFAAEPPRDLVLQTGPATDPQALDWGARPTPEVVRPGPPGIHQVWFADHLITTAAAPPKAMTTAWSNVYILHDDAVLETWHYDPLADSFDLQTRVQYPGAIDVTTGAGKVWVMVRETRAVAVDQVNVIASGRGFTIAPDIGTGTVKAKTLGVESNRVTRTRGNALFSEVGSAVIDLGSYDGIEAGDRVTFWQGQPASTPSLLERGGPRENRQVEHEVAQGTVEVVELRRALVSLDRGARVADGATVEKVRGTHPPPLFPSRLGEVFELDAIARPMLGLNTFGGGVIAQARAAYRFAMPLYAAARLDPVAAGTANKRSAVAYGVGGLVGVDGDIFAFGVGAGVSSLDTDGTEDESTVPTVLQEARIGAGDGLNMTFASSVAISPETLADQQRFVLSLVQAQLSLPAGRRAEILAEGALGELGARWLMGGGSVWVRGNGDIGSVGIELLAGVGEVSDGATTLTGPSIAGGVKTRF